LPDLKVEVQRHPSLEELHTFAIQNQNGWMSQILSFLQDGHLPVDKDEGRKVKKQAARFTILNDILYKKGLFHALPEVRRGRRNQIHLGGGPRRNLWRRKYNNHMSFLVSKLVDIIILVLPSKIIKTIYTLSDRETWSIGKLLAWDDISGVNLRKILHIIS